MSDILPLSNTNIAFASCSRTLFLSTFLNSLKIILFSSANLIISSLDFPEILNLNSSASSLDLKLNCLKLLSSRLTNKFLFVIIIFFKFDF